MWSLGWVGKIRPHREISIEGHLLPFFLSETGDFFYTQSGGARQSNGYGRHPEYDHLAGLEYDFWLDWKPAWRKGLLLRWEFSYFAPGGYVRESLRQSGGHQAAWAMITTVKYNF